MVSSVPFIGFPMQITLHLSSLYFICFFFNVIVQILTDFIKVFKAELCLLCTEWLCIQKDFVTWLLISFLSLFANECKKNFCQCKSMIISMLCKIRLLSFSSLSNYLFVYIFRRNLCVCPGTGYRDKIPEAAPMLDRVSSSQLQDSHTSDQSWTQQGCCQGLCDNLLKKG